jgi:hypothetical protein
VKSQRGLSSEECGLAGMMISRCPWRRASSEYAPGPRHKSAVAITAVKIAETVAGETFKIGTRIKPKAVPKLIRTPRLQANQLNSPNRSNSPHIDDSAATVKINTLASCHAMK